MKAIKAIAFCFCLASLPTVSLADHDAATTARPDILFIALDADANVAVVRPAKEQTSLLQESDITTISKGSSDP